MAFEPETMTLEALRALPAPSFAERDPFVIKADLIAKFESYSKRKLYPAQTEMFVIEVMAYSKANLGEAVQLGFLQNRAIWAEGRHLDEVGANVSTFRLEAQTATANVEFTLSETRATGIVIPKGTRVSAGSDLVFKTDRELIIAAGQSTGIVPVSASASGTAYNGLQVGQIEDVLDPIAYVSSVSNMEISSGGSDIEADDRYRLRVVNALERVSKAGPKQGYIENVKAVNPSIIAVEVVRPEPGYIHITPLMIDGISSDQVDQAILDYLDPETRRPMGDDVSIVKASRVGFDVVMELKIKPNTGAGLAEKAEMAIRDRFAVWSSTLGAQVAPTALVEAVRSVVGVVGVIGPAFEFTDLPATAFAGIDELTINVVEAPNV